MSIVYSHQFNYIKRFVLTVDIIYKTLKWDKNFSGAEKKKKSQIVGQEKMKNIELNYLFLEDFCLK